MINGELIEWRDTYIYGEQYEVSNTGMVRNKITGHILKQQEDISRQFLQFLEQFY